MTTSRRRRRPARRTDLAAPPTFGEFWHLTRGLPLLSGYASRDELLAGWRAHRAVILPAWVAAFPCTRPFSWWVSEGRERAVLPTAPWRFSREGWADGPRFGHLHSHTIPPIQESERCYLDRHGLLSDTERAAPVAEDEGWLLASRCLYHDIYGEGEA